MKERQICCFAPICGENAHTLILGTMPSAASLAQAFYYGHPRNAFWPMMFELLGESYASAPEQKQSLLVRHGIALWDVAASCERQGSLDSAIRHPVPNDIPGLLRQNPGIERILFNGSAAQTLFRRLLPGAGEGLLCARLPSTSPAYTLPYAQKRAAWAIYIQP